MLAKAALLVLSSLVLAPGQAGRVAFVRAGEVRVRSFQLESDLELYDLDVVRNGVSAGAPPDLALRHTEVLTVRVRDEIDEARSGLAMRFERRFEQAKLSVTSTARGSLSPEDAGEPRVSRSPFEGRTVSFSRLRGPQLVPLPGAPEKESAEEPATAALLAGLEQDMDFADLLGDGWTPDAKSWSLEPELFARLHEPGGRLAIGAEPGQVPVRPTERWTGRFSARVPERVGPTVVPIPVAPAREVERLTFELSFDIVRTTDRTAELEASIEKRAGLDFDVLSATSTTTYRGEGRCVWNLQLGRLESLELEATVQLLDEKDFRFEESAGPIVQEQTQRLSGTSKLRYSIE